MTSLSDRVDLELASASSSSAACPSFQLFKRTMSAEIIELDTLRRSLETVGVPTSSDIEGDNALHSSRAASWLVSLGVLSGKKKAWEEELSHVSQGYKALITSHVSEPELVQYLRGALPCSPVKGSKGKVLPVADHPLATSPCSDWRRYWSDMSVFDEINKDVFRTRSEIRWFRRPLKDSSLSVHRPKEPPLANIISPSIRYDAFSRILFVHAKVHPHIRYVQGMNEILAPIFLVCLSGIGRDDWEKGEAAAYRAFEKVMESQEEIYAGREVAVSDPTSPIMRRLERMEDVLKKNDPEVMFRLREMHLNFEFFALRWLMLLVAQEFEMASVLRLWDAVLPSLERKQGGRMQGIDEEHAPLMPYLAAAMVIKIRDVILAGDFSSVMHHLQRYPPFEAKDLLKVGFELREGTFFIPSDFRRKSEFLGKIKIDPVKRLSTFSSPLWDNLDSLPAPEIVQIPPRLVTPPPSSIESMPDLEGEGERVLPLKTSISVEELPSFLSPCSSTYLQHSPSVAEGEKDEAEKIEKSRVAGKSKSTVSAARLLKISVGKKIGSALKALKNPNKKRRPSYVHAK